MVNHVGDIHGDECWVGYTESSKSFGLLEAKRSILFCIKRLALR
jgi:hypothetical protein